MGVLRRHGVNHLDTAASYGDSELRLRPWLNGHRDEYFLATKTDERSASGAYASILRSLERLDVDRIDSIQLHNLVEEDEFDQAHAKSGAVEGLARARDEGLVAFIGVTGHGLRIPSMHLRSLERFPFDSVLFPYNYALLRDDSYRRDVDALLSACVDRGVAVQTIKSIARRRWAPSSSNDDHRSWYEPLADTAAVARAVGFVLEHESLFLISSSDYELLEPTLAAAEDPSPPRKGQLDEDVERLGMSALFDGGALERI